MVFHPFEGWDAWNSPSEAVDAATEGWVLINGSLGLLDNQVVLSARTGCADAVAATNIQNPAIPAWSSVRSPASGSSRASGMAR